MERPAGPQIRQVGQAYEAGGPVALLNRHAGVDVRDVFEFEHSSNYINAERFAIRI